MKYEGYYDILEEPIKSKSLLEVQKQIESLGGYDKNNSSCFQEYETAWIMEYNFIGRQTAQHYFSMKDKKWHRSLNKITNYLSWSNAKKPIKYIAQWILSITGHKAKHKKFVKALIQKRKIDELYGK